MPPDDRSGRGVRCAPAGRDFRNPAGGCPCGSRRLFIPSETAVALSRDPAAGTEKVLQESWSLPLRRGSEARRRRPGDPFHGRDRDRLPGAHLTPAPLRPKSPMAAAAPRVPVRVSARPPGHCATPPTNPEVGVRRRSRPAARLPPPRPERRLRERPWEGVWDGVAGGGAGHKKR